MIHHKVTCDACGKDLTHTGYESEYRIAVTPERLPLDPRAGTVMGMRLGCDIRAPMHFCDLDCLFKKLTPPAAAPSA
jgi:hypothetical protein